jgi:saccharopine dehydrogenase-like NADP-dependent oxidoreductase
VANNQRALVVGAAGGVGRAVLSLLEGSPSGRRIASTLDSLLLLDRAAGRRTLPLEIGALLPPGTIRSADDLATIIRDHQVTQVVDLSSLDTIDCTAVCDDLGADFLCTSVEEWAGQAPVPTDAAISPLLPSQRPLLDRSHLVGSGANPGIVNALVFAALEEFGRRMGVPPSVESLDVHAILITEEDTTREAVGAPSTDVFAMTWSPAHCLEELFEPRAFAVADGRIVEFDHAPTEGRYMARCGDRTIRGMLVPHEETVTLAERFPTVEIGFIYRIPPAARRALEAHPSRNRADLWKTRRLYPPYTDNLAGEDRLGVLICSRRFGELWVGFETKVADALRFGTNATQLQVAAGVIAGWSQLGLRGGIHFVEDLDWRHFMRTIAEVLGPPIVVHDRAALPSSLADRRELEVEREMAAVMRGAGGSRPA